MTEEEYNLEQKRLKSLISKNQRLAREYNQNIRLGKRQLKELERNFKKELREKARAEKPKYTPSYIDCSVEYCYRYGDDSGFCWSHNPNKLRCSQENCGGSAIKNGKFCAIHNPDLERCVAENCESPVMRNEQVCRKHNLKYLERIKRKPTKTNVQKP